MAPIQARKPEEQLISGQKKSATESKAYVRSSFFKYYIHDGADSCRLELMGELSEADVPELSGCWATAKTTLACRNVILDLRGLKSVDDAAKPWIISMVGEGAVLVPDTFLRDGIADRADRLAGQTSSGLFHRLAWFLRGCRTMPAQSSTQAR